MPVWRKQLLNIQKRMYRRNQRLIRESVGQQSREVKAYARGYSGYLREFQDVTSKHELIKHVVGSDIVYHGDYHTLRESQRSIYQMLSRACVSRNVILCLEMFMSDDQEHVDRFMSGSIGKSAFFRRIDYGNTWGFDWESWHPIFELCKEKGIRVIGINSRIQSGKSLKRRDESAAKIVGRTLLENPGALVYVVDGDYHVSPNHLPKEVNARLGVFDIVPRRTIIYQNAENFYWQLAEVGKENAEILQVSSESFCLMNTTPANKLQSYINWLEYGDQLHYPGGEQWAQFMETTQSALVPKMIETICNALEVDVRREDLERLEVYHARDLGAMKAIMEKQLHSVQQCRIRRKIADGEAFLLESCSEDGERSFLMYLPGTSLTMAAEEAAHFVNASCRGVPGPNVSKFGCFYRNAIVECLGYFGSKIINERRKPESTSAIRTFLGRHKAEVPQDRSQRLRVAVGHELLRHHYLEKNGAGKEVFTRKLKDVYTSRSQLPRILSTQLGYILGDRLFQAVHRGTVPMRVVRELFSRSFSEENEAFEEYLNLSAMVRRRSAKRR